MNVGQILETHLGWGARKLGEQIDRYLTTNWSPAVLREKMKKVFTSEQAHQFIDGLEDEDVGASPASCGAGAHRHPGLRRRQGDEIKGVLTMAGLTPTGRARSSTVAPARRSTTTSPSA
jgi:DNA-directed RNA polymerase subunit beta